MNVDSSPLGCDEATSRRFFTQRLLALGVASLATATLGLSGCAASGGGSHKKNSPNTVEGWITESKPGDEP